MANILKISHRGASAYEPENTLRAIKRALEYAVDMVEVDVRETKDGQIVVIHDETLERTTNGRGYVHQTNFSELRKLDAGKGERIPTLREVVDLVKGRVGLVIELKDPGTTDKVAEILARNNFVNQTLVTSFIHSAVKTIKELNPQLKTGVIFRSAPIKPSRLAVDANANALFPYHRYVTTRMIDDAHSNHLTVNVWTVDTREEIEHYAKIGVDGIVTNRPDLLKDL
jgi:glycerophosphoryl diester phosphodiesterase